MIENPLSEPTKSKYNPVKKIRKWIILEKIGNPKSFCVSDGFYTYWGLVYDDITIGIDTAWAIPEDVKKWIRSTYIDKYVLSKHCTNVFIK